MTSLLRWRTAARACTKPEYRIEFVRAIDEAQLRMTEFYNHPDDGTLAACQSAWSHADRLYRFLPAEGTPAPLGGAPEPTKFAA